MIKFRHIFNNHRLGQKTVEAHRIDENSRFACYEWREGGWAIFHIRTSGNPFKTLSFEYSQAKELLVGVENFLSDEMIANVMSNPLSMESEKVKIHLEDMAKYILDKNPKKGDIPEDVRELAAIVDKHLLNRSISLKFTRGKWKVRVHGEKIKAVGTYDTYLEAYTKAFEIYEDGIPSFEAHLGLTVKNT